ncbi:elongation factor P hydroxylase [Aurantivibrio plasticivorans]
MSVLDQSATTHHQSRDLERLFNQEFIDFQTQLVGGATEPLYSPGRVEAETSTIYYTRDYFASALHEVSHWCIAGSARRQQEDYGYWYEPDGRDAQQQQLFERVEVKPQALEWIFSAASGYRFRLSADNLNAAVGLSEHFKDAVLDQVQRYCRDGLSIRPARFMARLADFYNVEQPLSSEHYTRDQL